MDDLQSPPPKIDNTTNSPNKIIPLVILWIFIVIIGGVEYFLYQKNSDIDDTSVTTAQSPSINTQELAIPTELPKDSQSPSLKKDDWENKISKQYVWKKVIPTTSSPASCDNLCDAKISCNINNHDDKKYCRKTWTIFGDAGEMLFDLCSGGTVNEKDFDAFYCCCPGTSAEISPLVTSPIKDSAGTKKLSTNSWSLSLKDEFKTEGTTLCNKIPRNIDGYALSWVFVTNEPSQIAHTLYWNTKNGGVYTINPTENLILNYNKDGASDESSIKVSLYRFETSSDLQDAFVPILGLSENKTENILQSESGVYWLLKYIYKNNNNLIEVVGKNEGDIKNLANSVMNACIDAPVFKTTTPKGFVAWRTKEFIDNASYEKITDQDTTLYLSSMYFGNLPAVLINDTLYGSVIDNISSVITIYPLNEKGRMDVGRGIYFITAKTINKNKILEFLRKNIISYIPYPYSEIGDTISETKSEYFGNKNYKIQQTTLRIKTKAPNSRINEVYIYSFSKGDATFFFVNNDSDLRAVDSIINNLD